MQTKEEARVRLEQTGTISAHAFNLGWEAAVAVAAEYHSVGVDKDAIDYCALGYCYDKAKSSVTLSIGRAHFTVTTEWLIEEVFRSLSGQGDDEFKKAAVKAMLREQKRRLGSP